MEFITRLEKLPLPVPHLIGLYCHFDIAHYSPETPAYLGLSLPPILKEAVPRRSAEFIAGRYLARLALIHLQAKQTHVAIGNNREPCWPAGFTGSVSHSNNIAVCTIARRHEYPLLGIDIEHYQDAEAAEEIAPVIASELELEMLAALPLPFHQSVTLLLSIKESLFKAFYPYTQHFMDFNTARITHIDLEKNRWQASIFIKEQRVPRLPRSICGYMCMKSDRLFTLVAEN